MKAVDISISLLLPEKNKVPSSITVSLSESTGKCTITIGREWKEYTIVDRLPSRLKTLRDYKDRAMVSCYGGCYNNDSPQRKIINQLVKFDFKENKDGGSPKVYRRASSKRSVKCKWSPTDRKVMHKGVLRKVWCSSNDTTKLAVKRLVTAKDGTRKYRFERI